MDRHGPIHLGEGQAIALIGDDLGGVRWRTTDKAALAAKSAQIQQFVPAPKGVPVAFGKILFSECNGTGIWGARTTATDGATEVQRRGATGLFPPYQVLVFENFAG